MIIMNDNINEIWWWMIMWKNEWIMKWINDEGNNENEKKMMIEMKKW